MRCSWRSSASISSVVRTASCFVIGLPHFRQGEILELADAFAGDVEFLADLLERQLVATVETEAQL